MACSGCKGGNCPSCNGMTTVNGGFGNQVVCGNCKGSGQHKACNGKG